MLGLRFAAQGSKTIKECTSKIEKQETPDLPTVLGSFPQIPKKHPRMVHK